MSAVQRFEFSDAKSSKFWEVAIVGAAVTVTYGRIGAAGKTQTKEYESDAVAKATAQKQVAEKLKKGYREVRSQPDERDFFEDLRLKGPLYDRLVRGEILQHAFDRSVIAELRPLGWFTGLDPEECERGVYEDLPIFIIYVGGYAEEQDTLIEAYPPLKARHYDHFFDFLIVDAAMRTVVGLGLGRKYRVFDEVSRDGLPFAGIAPDAVRALMAHMPWDFYSRFRTALVNQGGNLMPEREEEEGWGDTDSELGAYFPDLDSEELEHNS